MKVKRKLRGLFGTVRPQRSAQNDAAGVAAPAGPPSPRMTFCLDAPPREEGDAGVETLSGWCLASRPIQFLSVLPKREVSVSARYGLSRPDVARSRPRLPHALTSGFRLDLPPGYVAEHKRMKLRVGMLTPEGRLRFYRARVSLHTNEPQRIRLKPLDEEAEGLPSSEEVERRLRTALENAPGLSLRIDIVNKCNLRCVMCHYSDDAIFKRPKREITPEEFREFFGSIAPDVREVILSCGDEPLVSKHFPEILSLLAEDGTPRGIEFCTNAMLMNGRIRNLLIEKGVTDLMLSMDGSTKATMERIRQGSKFERVVANILALRDLKSAAGSVYPRMTMDFVMMNSNIHEAPAFVELCREIGAESIDFRHVVPSQYWDDPEEKLANFPAKYNYYRRRILEEAERFDLRVYLPPPLDAAEDWQPGPEIPRIDLSDFRMVEPDGAAGPPPAPKAFPPDFAPRDVRGSARSVFASTFCPLPFSEIMVRGQDEVLPCAWHRAPLGRLSDGRSLSDIFFGEEFQRVRRNMFRPEGDPNCRGCPIKGELLPTNPAQPGKEPEPAAESSDGG